MEVWMGWCSWIHIIFIAESMACSESICEITMINNYSAHTQSYMLWYNRSRDGCILQLYLINMIFGLIQYRHAIHSLFCCYVYRLDNRVWMVMPWKVKLYILYSQLDMHLGISTVNQHPITVLSTPALRAQVCITQYDVTLLLLWPHDSNIYLFSLWQLPQASFCIGSI